MQPTPLLPSPNTTTSTHLLTTRVITSTLTPTEEAEAATEAAEEATEVAEEVTTTSLLMKEKEKLLKTTKEAIPEEEEVVIEEAEVATEEEEVATTISPLTTRREAISEEKATSMRNMKESTDPEEATEGEEEAEEDLLPEATISLSTELRGQSLLLRKKELNQLRTSQLLTDTTKSTIITTSKESPESNTTHMIDTVALEEAESSRKKVMAEATGATPDKTTEKKLKKAKK